MNIRQTTKCAPTPLLWNVLHLLEIKFLNYGYLEMHTTSTRANIPKIQKFIKIPLFYVVGTKMCHMCAHQKNFVLSHPYIPNVFQNQFWLPGSIFRPSCDSSKFKSAPKNDLKKISIYLAEKWDKMSIPPKFLSKILIGWCAHSYPTFYMLPRNGLKYSDFIFYVASTKNNKFDFYSFFILLKQIA